MKKRNIFISLGLATAMLVGASTALVLGSKSAPKEVKADGETWMINISFDAKTLISHEGFDTTSLYAHTYTDGLGDDKYFQMYPIETGSQYYQVNATFADGYTFNRLQFKFNETSGEKWSSPYEANESKGTHSKQLVCGFSVWNEGVNWTFSLSGTDDLSVCYAPSSQVRSYYFEEDPANARFIIRDFVADNVSTYYYQLYYRKSWSYTAITLNDVDSDRNNPAGAMSYVTTEWCNMREGTYDIIIKNNNSGNGIMEFKKYQTTSSYIYFVSQSNDDDSNIYAYTFGHDEALGAFPGTQLTEQAYSAGLSFVEPADGFKFQNQEHKVYRISITLGYPADDHIIFNNGSSTGQSANLLLQPGAAYWHGSPAESYSLEAGAALDVFFDLQNVLKSASAYEKDELNYTKSVCSVSDSDALRLYNAYNAFTASQKADFFDCSYIKTYYDAGTGHGLYTTYRSASEIFYQLGVQAGLVGSSNRMNPLSNNTNVVIIVVTASIAVISAAGAFFIIRKRKHQ